MDRLIGRPVLNAPEGINWNDDQLAEAFRGLGSEIELSDMITLRAKPNIALMRYESDLSLDLYQRTFLPSPFSALGAEDDLVVQLSMSRISNRSLDTPILSIFSSLATAGSINRCWTS